MQFQILLLFILCCLSATAQVIQVSNPSRLPAHTGKFKVIAKNNDGIVVRLFGTEDVLNVYDGNLKLQTTRTINFKNQDGPVQHIMLNKTGAVIFYLEQDKKRSLLYAQPVNGKLVEIGKPVLIDSIFDSKELVASNLRFKTSADQSYLLTYYPTFTYGKVESIKCICVDRSLQVIYNKTIPLNRNEKELEESRALIDNNGNSFIILKPESVLENAAYDVFRIDNKGNLQTYSVNTGEKLFNEATFEIDNKNGNLILTAFVDKQPIGTEVAASGFIYASYDPANGTEIKKNFMAFPNSFVAELTGRENVNNTGLYTFSIRKTILRNDGGVLIVAESYIKDTREQVIPIGIQPGYNSYRSSDVFQFNDIIAFSITPNGSIDWTSIMRKKQVSEDDNGVYSSFLTVNEKQKIRFIYLDEISGGAVLNQYVLNSNGKSNREIIFNQDDRDVMLLPKMGKQISPNEVVLPSFKGNELKLVKITF